MKTCHGLFKSKVDFNYFSQILKSRHNVVNTEKYLTEASKEGFKKLLK